MDSKYKEIRIGILSRLLITLSFIFYALSFINKNLSLIYGNYFLFSINNYEVYRLITGIFICENIWELFLQCFLIFSVFNFYENLEGTIRFTAKFTINVVLFQILVLIVQFIISQFYPIIIIYSIKGLQALSFVYLIKHILTTNTKHIFVYKCSSVNDRFLLVSTILLFFILNRDEFKFELLVAFYYGYLLCKLKKYLDYNLSKEKIRLFEKNESLKFFIKCKCFILIDEQLDIEALEKAAEEVGNTNDKNCNKEDTSLDDHHDASLTIKEVDTITVLDEENTSKANNKKEANLDLDILI